MSGQGAVLRQELAARIQLIDRLAKSHTLKLSEYQQLLEPLPGGIPAEGIDGMPSERIGEIPAEGIDGITLEESLPGGSVAGYARKRAVEARQPYYGNQVYIRGLIEVGNVCRNDCLYCGIRKSNGACDRYLLTEGRF